MQMVASIQCTQVCVYWHFTAAMITAYPFTLKHESDSRKYVIFQQTCIYIFSKHAGSMCPVSNEGQARMRAHQTESKSIRANAHS